MDNNLMSNEDLKQWLRLQILDSFLTTYEEVNTYFFIIKA